MTEAVSTERRGDSPPPTPFFASKGMPRSSKRADQFFYGLTLTFGLSILLITGLIALELWINSQQIRHQFGWSFIWTQTWDPVMGDHGALPFIFGTLVSSFLSMLIAIPVGIGAALFLSELAPRKLSDILAFITELLAAVPSVIYGLVGMFLLVPLMRTTIQPFLQKTLGFLPIFQGPMYGIGMLTAGILLSIMVVPFIITVSREVFLLVPSAQREAALALGATHWEVVRLVVLPYSKSGIFGAAFLALARALGETMAVTMVIGNAARIAASLFAPGYTMAAVIANEFTEATEDHHLSALIAVGLVLFGITLIVNAIARFMLLMLERRAKSGGGGH